MVPREEKWDLEIDVSSYCPKQTFYRPPNFTAKGWKSGKNQVYIAF